MIYATSFVVILMGKKIKGTTSPGARVSCQRPVWVEGGGGGCHQRKFEIALLEKLLLVWSWNLLCMLEMSKTEWNSNIWNFSGKIFNFGLCFTENRLFGGSAMFMMSLWRHMLDVCTYVGMYGKRGPIPILWYQLAISGRFSFQVHGGALGKQKKAW